MKSPRCLSPDSQGLPEFSNAHECIALTSWVPGSDQFVSDIVFMASVLSLKGHFHLNGSTVFAQM